MNTPKNLKASSVAQPSHPRSPKGRAPIRGQRPASRQPAESDTGADEGLGEGETAPVARKRREALSHVGGPIEMGGDDRAVQEVLSRALAVSASRDDVLEHVHGFHSYPARLHPTTARLLVEGLSAPGGTVLDPFCGSGTILLEARLLGRAALGVDANPLAIELVWLKAGGLSPELCKALPAAAAAVAAHAQTRRITKAGPSYRYSDSDRELYDAHVLLELDGLRDGIRTLELPSELRRALLLVLSSLLTKVSRQPGDTSGDRVPRRLAGGFVIGFFEKRTELLVKQLEAYRARVPASDPPWQVWVGDARELRPIASQSVDLIVTSPPYAGVYDYHEQHATRLRWLGLDSREFEANELGARRHLERLPFARALGAWEQDLTAFLKETRRVLRGPGKAVIVMADSVLVGRPLWALDLMKKLAKLADLKLVAVASQHRPHFHRATANAFVERPRQEHVIVLQGR